MSLTTLEITTAIVHERVERMPTGPIDFLDHELHDIARQFAVPEPITVLDFPDKGNINQHTFLILAGDPLESRQFLLQRINQLVFTRPRRVMAAMMASIEAQNATLARDSREDVGDWTAITLIPTRDGRPYLELQDERGLTFWRLMERIPDCRTFKSLGEVLEPAHRLRLAAEAGRGLALYGRLTADMDASGLSSPLPGYRDTRLYYNQILSVLAGNRTMEQAFEFLPVDPVLRHSTEHHFVLHLSEEEFRRRAEDPSVRECIDTALACESFGLTLADAMASGRIRTVAIHGDTKLDNFLFCSRTSRVKAVVDLDTIMPHTWLSDWGDMVRSLTNVAGEKERDLSRVGVDMEVFEAIARGFLEAAGPLPEAEVALMADAVQILTLELGIRFLADYLRGDSYFRLGPEDAPDLNRVRALVQFTLFNRMRERQAQMRAIIARYAQTA
jgi:hypothetical protein